MPTPSVLHGLLLLALWLPFTASARTAPVAVAETNACDAPGFATLLSPVAREAVDARAYWLDSHVIQWPGARSHEGLPRFRLYHSADGTLVAAAGAPVSGADGAMALAPQTGALPEALAQRFDFIGDGPVFALDPADVAGLAVLLTGQLLLVQEDESGRVIDATSLQNPGVLDDFYAAAAQAGELGVSVGDGTTRFALWAPTARAVHICVHEDGTAPASARLPLQRDPETGIWSASQTRDLRGNYYTYLVEVFVPGTGIVRNRVTDPYSISLTTDSTRSFIADLDHPALAPDGWDDAPRPDAPRSMTDMAVYELHVRDFSVGDATVAAAHRGKYLGFADPRSAGMRHLRALADAGMTDIHLLPVFDLATVPETGCVTVDISDAPPDSERQQAAAMANAARDCFNWGYDPFHFNAPEGSYATDSADGATRVRELRAMVMALHAAGLRVGMDVVYNHTTVSGQQEKSVLDRIVPGYYHRLDSQGRVERSTCCDNTATEHPMMARLMIDSAALWARDYRIDSFRFDLMGHQPRDAMLALQQRVDEAAGRHVPLIGEGWNFGEVADGARFVQAAQRPLAGTGIATFSDRARDALRGGGCCDSGADLIARQGWLNGLHYAPNALGATSDGAGTREALLRAADLVRVGLAGTLADVRLRTFDGRDSKLSAIDYEGQPAGYAAQPREVVNYVENHDNPTLFDVNALKLSRDTSSEDRARVQLLGAAVVAFSQGIAYYHAGIDVLRSKSLDRNSFDSGDWFNRLDWTYTDNGFGAGLPPAAEGAKDWPLLAPVLVNGDIKPAPRDIAWMRDAFRDLLRIRASSTLFRLRSADDVQARLRFHDTGPEQNPVLIAVELDGAGYPDARFARVLYLVNASPQAQSLVIPDAAGTPYVLHPVHRAADAADARPRELAHFDAATGRFQVPPRTAVVYVEE